MASHFRDNTNERNTRDAAAVNPNSRAAIRARKEAEEREKQEWIARRKREEKAAAEAEAKEKAAWIAERRRQEKAAEEELRAREKAAREAERKRRAEKRAEKARKVLRVVKIVLLVLVSLAVLAGGAGLYAAFRISNSETNFPNVYVNGIDVGGLTKEETDGRGLGQHREPDPDRAAAHGRERGAGPHGGGPCHGQERRGGGCLPLRP